MTIRRDQIALNAIQWINVKADPTDPNSEDLWLYREPSFVAQYPSVLAQVRDAGFGAVMMEVLDTQTLQNYASMIADSGLTLAPGYCQIALPEEHGVTLERGSAEWVRWFDSVRRKAEESNYFGLKTIFLAPEVHWLDSSTRTLRAAAVGADFDQSRLERVTEYLNDAAVVLQAEGIRPGLHNHVGTWVETREEIDYVLGQIDDSVLGASFDIGHLEWAGIDAKEMLTAYADRLVDLHFKDLDLSVAAASRQTPASYRATSDKGLFLEPGLGDIDLDGVLTALPDGFGGWIIIEVDKASMDPWESALVTSRWLSEHVTARVTA